MRKEIRELGEWYEDDSFDWVEILMLVAVACAVAVAVIEIIGADTILGWLA